MVSAGGGGINLDVSIEIPNSVEVGNKPFYFNVSLSNPQDRPVAFIATIWHGGPGWSKAVTNAWFSQNSNVYNMECNDYIDGCFHYWSGIIDPHEKAYFSLPTFSGDEVGNFKFADVMIRTDTGEIHYERYLHVIPVPIPMPTSTPTPMPIPATPTPKDTLFSFNVYPSEVKVGSQFDLVFGRKTEINSHVAITITIPPGIKLPYSPGCEDGNGCVTHSYFWYDHTGTEYGILTPIATSSGHKKIKGEFYEVSTGRYIVLETTLNVVDPQSSPVPTTISISPTPTQVLPITATPSPVTTAIPTSPTPTTPSPEASQIPTSPTPVSTPITITVPPTPTLAYPMGTPPPKTMGVRLFLPMVNSSTN